MKPRSTFLYIQYSLKYETPHRSLMLFQFWFHFSKRRKWTRARRNPWKTLIFPWDALQRFSLAPRSLSCCHLLINSRGLHYEIQLNPTSERDFCRCMRTACYERGASCRTTYDATDTLKQSTLSGCSLRARSSISQLSIENLFADLSSGLEEFWESGKPWHNIVMIWKRYVKEYSMDSMFPTM